MAGSTIRATPTNMAGSAMAVMRTEYNKLIDDVEALRAGLATLAAAFNAHTHRTPTTNPGYTSIPNTNTSDAGSTGGTSAVVTITSYDAAADLLAAKVADNNGNT